MTEEKKFCFMVMPFEPEMFYIYQYLKTQVEKENEITCKRADAEYQTKPFSEKIKNYIKKADLIIADCTHQNANVYYEIGLAHSLEKEVIIISQDELKSNIHHYEFIRYDLKNPDEFISKLNQAINNFFKLDFDLYYNNARLLVQKFKEDENVDLDIIGKEDFIKRFKTERSIQKLPEKTSEQIKERLMMLLLVNPDLRIRSQMTMWLSEKASSIKLSWEPPTME